MPTYFELVFINLSGSLHYQLYILLALCALTQSTIATPEQTSEIIKLPSTNISDSENCAYYPKVYCPESDKYCLTATYTNAFESNEDYYEDDDDDMGSCAIVCKEQPQDITQLFNTFYKSVRGKRMQFYIRNIYELPVKLFATNMSYSAKLDYESNTDKNMNILEQATNVREITLYIKSYVADEKWLGTFLRYQNTLKRLKLTLVRKDAHVTLPVDSFHKLNELQELEIYIKNKDPAVGGLKNLTLAHLQQLYKLKRLNLTGNQNPAVKGLKNLTRTHFQNLYKLRRLNLIGNNMQTLERDLFSTLHELNSLKLRGNALRQLAPDLFAAQSKLIELDLGGNQLEYLPIQLFTHTPLLFQLRLDQNRLHALENMLATLKPLNYLNLLDLSNNHFVNIAHANDTLLTRISFKRVNDLGHIWDYLKQTYHNVPYPTPTLDFSHNRLTNFSLDWLTYAAVTCNARIQLSNNRIRYLHALTQPTNVAPSCRRELIMNENPLHCDCQLAWVYNLNFRAASSITTSTTSWYCATPTHLRGRTLGALQRNDICKWSALFCPAKCTCKQQVGGVDKSDYAALVINCTGAHSTVGAMQLPRPEQVALTQTTLFIERCNLTELPSNVNAGFSNVTRLYAAANNITTISVSHLPPTLYLLDLRANNLQHLSADFLDKYLNASTHLQALYLSHNPWRCDCESMQFLYTLRKQRARIPDIEQLFCANHRGVALLHAEMSEICLRRAHIITSIILPLLALLLAAIMLLILTTLYYKYKIEVKVWLYAHNLCVFWINEEELDENKLFDAFISYAHQQNHYVNHVLLQGLEQGQPSFRICIHDRNWLAGACIPDQIVKSVEQSCRTIFVLSQDFIESDWGRMEFRTAHQSALNEGRARIIVIKYGELANLERLDKELQAYLKMNTYLEWDDPRFWQKLRYAMPHRKRTEFGTKTVKVAPRIYIPE